MNESIESTAYHEASHAVLAYITGVYLIEGIDIRGASRAQVNVQRDGRLCNARMLDNHGKLINHDREQAIILAAGWEGERCYLTGQGLEFDERDLDIGAHGDLQEVRELLGSGAWYDVRARAAHYLSQTAIWSVVQAVANELLKRGGVLSANQVTDVLFNACLDVDLPESQILA